MLELSFFVRLWYVIWNKMRINRFGAYVKKSCIRRPHYTSSNHLNHFKESVQGQDRRQTEVKRLPYAEV